MTGVQTYGMHHTESRGTNKLILWKSCVRYNQGMIDHQHSKALRSYNPTQYCQGESVVMPVSVVFVPILAVTLLMKRIPRL